MNSNIYYNYNKLYVFDIKSFFFKNKVIYIHKLIFFLLWISLNNTSFKTSFFLFYN